MHLKALTKLETLGLGSTQITDAGLVHLKGLTKLESLTLSDTDVTDAGLEHLIAHTGLQTLSLRNTLITEKGLATLEHSLPTCEIASGRWDFFTKRFLEKHGASVTRANGSRGPIVSVQFPSFSHITDLQLGHLRGLTKLQTLHLRHTEISDVGLEHLKGLNSMK